MTYPVRLLALTVTAWAFLSCGGNSSTPPENDPDPVNGPIDPVFVPAVGGPGTLDVATWNLLFFGSSASGPDNDVLQRRMVESVIEGSDLDLWAVQEVVDPVDFEELLDSLPGYEGILANDPRVESGADYYSDFGDTELKVGLIYKSEVAELREARVVLTEFDFDFAGRPPLELRLRVTVGGVTEDVTVLVLHAKANAQLTSFERRRNAAEGLLDYLTRSLPTEPVLVLGDFNDDIDESIAAGRDTPYRALVDAEPDWVFASAPLTGAGETSTLDFEDVIDHIFVSDEVYDGYEVDSAAVLRPDTLIQDYAQTTTDHLPVVARFRLGG